MAIEGLVEQLIKALQENTAAHKASSGTKAATSNGGKASTAKLAVTYDQMKAACLAVRDHEKGGKTVISKIIKDIGKAEALAKIKEPEYAAVLKAAEEKLDELNAETSDGDGEGDEI